MAVIVFAPLFFLFLTGGISRYVVEAYAKGDFDGITRIISSIFFPVAAMVCAFLVIGVAVSMNVDHILTIAPAMVSDAQIMMGLLVASFCVQMLGVPFTASFHVRQRFVELNLLGVARDLFRIAMLFVLLLEIGPQVIWVVVANVTADILYTIVVAARSRRMIPQMRIRLSAFDRATTRTLMGFGLWTTLGRLGSVMYTNAATLILNFSGSALDVTNFYVGATIFRQINNTASLVVQPLQPVLTAFHALEEKRRLARTVFRLGRYSTWASLAIATPLSIYSAPFIKLYVGEQYAAAAAVLSLFMVIFVFDKPTHLLAMTAMATEQVQAFFLPAFLFQAGGLVVMLLFATLTDLGALGMTIAVAMTAISSQIFYYWRLCIRLTGASASTFVKEVLIPGYLPAVAGALVWFTLIVASPPDTWATLALHVLVGEAFYVFVLLCLGFDRNEWTELRHVLARVKPA
ncbi:hypothetical protein DLJ53_33720 [Acuticoccus sediminis]|uniref:Membrane protein involved in the export of O-antigen and teichoic acid n=2 Tax=Acuticoccus sediminis TaxID=2184697 RepID=A0A8B2NNE1_9HYPH|nr:hypothetical protein DLJ53_33720 [Acuticoccus sediminis]